MHAAVLVTTHRRCILACTFPLLKGPAALFQVHHLTCQTCSLLTTAYYADGCATQVCNGSTRRRRLVPADRQAAQGSEEGPRPVTRSAPVMLLQLQHQNSTAAVLCTKSALAALQQRLYRHHAEHPGLLQSLGCVGLAAACKLVSHYTSVLRAKLNF